LIKIKSRNDSRKERHIRIRSHLFGTAEKPRLCVFRSNKYIYAQIIDDTIGHTLVAATTVENDIKNMLEDKKSTANIKAASILGKMIAERALGKGIKTVVFDRAGYKYHGKVKALADAAREAGLVF